MHLLQSGRAGRTPVAVGPRQRWRDYMRIEGENQTAAESRCYTRKASPEKPAMFLSMRRFAFLFLLSSLVLPLHAATVSRQSAEDFSEKMALIQRQGAATTSQGVG